MIAHIWKTALRRLWQHKTFTLIHLAGLALGLASVILALLYARYENGFDNFHPDPSQLYRVVTTMRTTAGGPLQDLGGTGQVQGPAFRDGVAGITSVTRVMGGNIYGDIYTADKAIRARQLFVDDNFFTSFNFPSIGGDARSALLQTDGAAISRSTAMRLFGHTNVVGETFQMDADPSAGRLGKPLTVRAVVEDAPARSSLQFDLLLNIRFLQLSFEDTYWLNAYMSTFVRLAPGASKATVEAGMRKVYDKMAAPQRSAQPFDPQISYSLQPVTDMHLHPLNADNSVGENGIVQTGNPLHYRLLLGIAGFILLMAAVNFIQLSNATAIDQAKAVALRRIAGGTTPQIIFQFLFQSLLICVSAMLCGIGLAIAALPVFNPLAGTAIRPVDLLDADLLPVLLLLPVVLMLLAGLYPAYVLSGFRPLQAFVQPRAPKGKLLAGKGLVVLQFSIAVALLLSTIVMYRQYTFMTERDLGFSPQSVIKTKIKGNRDPKVITPQLRAELERVPGVEGISFSGNAGLLHAYAGNRELDAFHIVADAQYAMVMGLQFISGKGLQADLPSGAVVNEAFVKRAGWKEPVGQTFRADSTLGAPLLTVTGVVRDFHLQPLHHRIQPMAMFAHSWYDGDVWIRTVPHQRSTVLAAVEKTWRETMPSAVFDYRFFEDQQVQAYREEWRWRRILTAATLLSMFVCCLGLYGIALHATRRRLREIGVRKVLGAGVPGLAALLSRDFLVPVGIALLIACPAAGWSMQLWLERFAYAVKVDSATYLLAAGIIFTVSAATVAFHTIAAARLNPVRVLRQTT